MRLIVVSFAFLALAFYELSGGADFEPRGVRASAPQTVAKLTPSEPRQPAPPVKAEQLVVKAALEPDAADQNPPPSQSVESDIDASTALAQVASGLNSGLSLFGDDTPTFALASLNQGASSLRQLAVTDNPVAAAPAASPEPVRDIREVAGTRVNLRDGPGTIYPVVARLNIGHEVEILGDSGTGWLRLRVLPEQHIGWISASLVSKNTN